MMSDKFHLHVGAGADELASVDVDQIPSDDAVIAEWLTVVQRLLLRAGVEVAGLRVGPVRLIPEDQGCRVGLERAPQANMEWFAELAEGLAHARQLQADLSLRIRGTAHSDARAQARRVVSRMLQDGLADALREQIETANTALRDEVRRLRALLRTQRTRGINLKATRHPDGAYSVTVVSSHSPETEGELAVKAAQFLGPLLVAFNEMQTGMRPESRETYAQETERSLPLDQWTLGSTLPAPVVEEIVTALLEGAEFVEFADGRLQMQELGDEGAVQLVYQDGQGEVLGDGTYRPGAEIVARCADPDVFRTFSRLLVALQERAVATPEDPDPDGTEDLTALTGPAFGSTFRLEDEGRQGYDEEEGDEEPSDESSDSADYDEEREEAAQAATDDHEPETDNPFA